MVSFKFGINEKLYNKQRLGDDTHAWQIVEGTVIELANHILEGKAYMSGCLEEGAKRKDDNIKEYQSIALDIDDNLTLEQARDEPFIKDYCGLIYTSPSHQQWKQKSQSQEWVEPRDRYRLVFVLPEAIEDKELWGCLYEVVSRYIPQADPSCKNVSRYFNGNTEAEVVLCDDSKTLSYTLIEEAKELKGIKIAQEKERDRIKSRPAPIQFPTEDTRELAEQALQFIPQRQPGSGNYHECLQVLMALESEFGNDAIAMAERWSPSIAGTTWKIPYKIKNIQRTSRGAVSIGSLFHIAKQYGFEMPKSSKSYSNGHNNHSYQDTKSLSTESKKESQSEKAGFDFEAIKDEYQQLRESVAELIDETDLLRQQFLMGKLAKAFGVRTEYLEKIAQDIQHKTDNEDFTWIEDELKNEDEQRHFLCPKHIARQSVQVLVAEGGCGKTMLVNDAVKSVACGESFLGEPCQKGKSLVLQADTPRAEALQYFRQAGFDEVPARSVAVHYNWSFNQLDKLEHWLANEGFDQVIIDCLTAANIGSDVDENSSLYAQGITRLAKLGEKYNTTFIVLHHANFQGQPRGSTAIKAACTELIHLEKDKESDCRWLYRTKSRTGFMDKLLIELNDEQFKWNVVEEPDETLIRGDVKQSAIAHLESNPDKEFTASELCHDLNFTYTAKDISKELRHYARLGYCKARAHWYDANNGERQKVMKFRGFDKGKKQSEPKPSTVEVDSTAVDDDGFEDIGF